MNQHGALKIPPNVFQAIAQCPLCWKPGQDYIMWTDWTVPQVKQNQAVLMGLGSPALYLSMCKNCLARWRTDRNGTRSDVTPGPGPDRTPSYLLDPPRLGSHETGKPQEPEVK